MCESIINTSQKIESRIFKFGTLNMSNTLMLLENFMKIHLMESEEGHANK